MSQTTKTPEILFVTFNPSTVDYLRFYLGTYLCKSVDIAVIGTRERSQQSLAEQMTKTSLYEVAPHLRPLVEALGNPANAGRNRRTVAERENLQTLLEGWTIAFRRTGLVSAFRRAAVLFSVVDRHLAGLDHLVSLDEISELLAANKLIELAADRTFNDTTLKGELFAALNALDAERQQAVDDVASAVVLPGVPFVWTSPQTRQLKHWTGLAVVGESENSLFSIAVRRLASRGELPGAEGEKHDLPVVLRFEPGSRAGQTRLAIFAHGKSLLATAIAWRKAECKVLGAEITDEQAAQTGAPIVTDQDGQSHEIAWLSPDEQMLGNLWPGNPGSKASKLSPRDLTALVFASLVSGSGVASRITEYCCSEMRRLSAPSAEGPAKLQDRSSGTCCPRSQESEQRRQTGGRGQGKPQRAA